jgi:hypothetical protein
MMLPIGLLVREKCCELVRLIWLREGISIKKLSVCALLHQKHVVLTSVVTY